jgi:hypothetical protein
MLHHGYLVNIKIGKKGEKKGLTLPIETMIKEVFTSVGFIYTTPWNGELVDYIPGILNIRHA